MLSPRLSYFKRSHFYTSAILLCALTFLTHSTAQQCVFETAAMLYKSDADDPEKVYRPTESGSDVQYYVSGDIDAIQTKIKSKKITVIHDEYSGHFVQFGSSETRCSRGSELLNRPNGEEIIVLTKSGELIKGYGAIFPYSESLKIYKDEHRSGSYYQSVSSTDDLVLLINYIGDDADTKFLVGGKELSKYSDKLYGYLKPAGAPIAKEETAKEESPQQDLTPVAQQISQEKTVQDKIVAEEAPQTDNQHKEETSPTFEELSIPAINVNNDNIIIETSTPTNTEPEITTTLITEEKTVITTQQDTVTTEVEAKNIISTESESSTTLIAEAPAPVIAYKPKTVLSDLEKDELMIKAKEKVETLGSCFEVLASTKVANSFKDENEKIAINLFIHDSVEVAVSSLSRKAYKHFKITAYLKKMRTYNYTDVQISFHNVSKVSNLRKNPDGTYTGIITFSQVFKGFIEGVPVYADRTDKNVEIIIKAREVFAGELQASIAWDVFLGNIGVDQTSPY